VCVHTPPLASAEDLLAEAVETVGKLGVTGESRIIKATYLTVISQVLPEPVSMVAKGASAGGKSYSTRTTRQLFNPAVLYQVTAGSQRSLIFTEEEFSQRTIVMFEATALREVAEKRDSDMTAMIVRTLLSEGRIVYDITERGDDGKMGTRRIIKQGPTNLIVTTIADNLHHENETRLLSLPVDESEDQTRAVMRRTAERRNQAEPFQPPDLATWHQLFHWLKHHGEHRVYIPYATYLADSAAASVVRMRRDFGVLLGMIEAHAVLHQVNRKRDPYNPHHRHARRLPRRQGHPCRRVRHHLRPADQASRPQRRRRGGRSGRRPRRRDRRPGGQAPEARAEPRQPSRWLTRCTGTPARSKIAACA
jgi:hypothetical protein